MTHTITITIKSPSVALDTLDLLQQATNKRPLSSSQRVALIENLQDYATVTHVSGFSFTLDEK